jgi:hypothetical protein
LAHQELQEIKDNKVRNTAIISVELNLNACQRVQVKMARKVHLDRKVGKVNLADLETRD